MRPLFFLLLMLLLLPAAHPRAQSSNMRFDANMANSGVSITKVGDLVAEIQIPDVDTSYLVLSNGNVFGNPPEFNLVEFPEFEIEVDPAEVGSQVTIDLSFPELSFDSGALVLSTFERSSFTVRMNNATESFGIGFVVDVQVSGLNAGQYQEFGYIQVQANLQ